MATVIFSNMGDTDTAVLRYIWMGMPNVKVVEITRSTRNPIRLVNEAIEQEHDTLIMCGHGTPAGLLNPAFNGSAYLVGAHNYMKIRCNRIIGIWCHAKDFAESYGVRGFWSSMFISNKGEASSNGIYSVSDKSITEQEILFCVRLNQLINDYIPMKTWVDSLRSDADYTNPTDCATTRRRLLRQAGISVPSCRPNPTAGELISAGCTMTTSTAIWMKNRPPAPTQWSYRTNRRAAVVSRRLPSRTRK